MSRAGAQLHSTNTHRSLQCARRRAPQSRTLALQGSTTPNQGPGRGAREAQRGKGVALCHPGNVGIRTQTQAPQIFTIQGSITTAHSPFGVPCPREGETREGTVPDWTHRSACSVLGHLVETFYNHGLLHFYTWPGTFPSVSFHTHPPSTVSLRGRGPRCLALSSVNGHKHTCCPGVR